MKQIEADFKQSRIEHYKNLSPEEITKIDLATRRIATRIAERENREVTWDDYQKAVEVIRDPRLPSPPGDDSGLISRAELINGRAAEQEAYEKLGPDGVEKLRKIASEVVAQEVMSEDFKEIIENPDAYALFKGTIENIKRAQRVKDKLIEQFDQHLGLQELLKSFPDQEEPIKSIGHGYVMKNFWNTINKS